MLHLEVGPCHHLTPSVYEKLKNYGIVNVIQFITEQDLETVSVKCQISFRDLLAIRRYLLAKHACVPLSGVQLYQSLVQSTAILSTGCEGLDRLLDGGLCTGEVMELMGATASGKTQICLSAALAVAANTTKEIVYFDIGGGFSASRLYEILLNTHQPDIPSVLQRIHVIHISDIHRLLAEIHNLKSTLCASESPQIKLVIIDCVTLALSVLRDSESCMHASHIVFALKSLSIDFSFAVLITRLSLSDDGWGRLRPDGGFDRLRSDVRPNVTLVVKRDSGVVGGACAETVIRVEVASSARLPSGRSVHISIGAQGLQPAHTFS